MLFLGTQKYIQFSFILDESRAVVGTYSGGMLCAAKLAPVHDLVRVRQNIGKQTAAESRRHAFDDIDILQLVVVQCMWRTLVVFVVHTRLPAGNTIDPDFGIRYRPSSNCPRHCDTTYEWSLDMLSISSWLCRLAPNDRCKPSNRYRDIVNCWAVYHRHLKLRRTQTQQRTTWREEKDQTKWKTHQTFLQSGVECITHIKYKCHFGSKNVFTYSFYTKQNHLRKKNDFIHWEQLRSDWNVKLKWCWSSNALLYKIRNRILFWADFQWQW